MALAEENIRRRTRVEEQLCLVVQMHEKYLHWLSQSGLIGKSQLSFFALKISAKSNQINVNSNR